MYLVFGEVYGGIGGEKLRGVHQWIFGCNSRGILSGLDWRCGSL